MAEFPRTACHFFSPSTRETSTTRLASRTIRKMPFPTWLGAAHLQSTRLAFKGHEAMLPYLYPLPTCPSPSESFPMHLITMEGRGRGELLSATPANSNPIPCWLPHLSPSSSLAKANFPLTSGQELISECVRAPPPTHTHARVPSATENRVMPHPGCPCSHFRVTPMSYVLTPPPLANLRRPRPSREDAVKGMLAKTVHTDYQSLCGS